MGSIVDCEPQFFRANVEADACTDVVAHLYRKEGFPAVGHPIAFHVLILHANGKIQVDAGTDQGSDGFLWKEFVTEIVFQISTLI